MAIPVKFYLLTLFRPTYASYEKKHCKLEDKISDFPGIEIAYVHDAIRILLSVLDLTALV